MSHLKFVFVCTLLVCLSGTGFAQPDAVTAVPLIVDKGSSLQVLLTEKLHFKENEPVLATVIEPVYAFDRVVIPAGSRLEGAITSFRKGGKSERIFAMLGGNFTPVREPQIAFHTLVLAGGARIPIETYVVPGTEKVVGSAAAAGSDLKNSFASTVKKPGKEQLKNLVWGLSPYRPQYVPAGTPLNAVLMEQVDFGEAVLENGALDEIGSEPPSDTIVSVRLVTPLDSRTAQPGESIEALLTRPVFSHDNRILFPAGARLHGNVTEVKPARARHRNGQLAFTLTTIAPPDSWISGAWRSQEIEGSLVSVQVTHDMKDLRIANNAARIVESKKRFIGPAWAFVKAARSLNSTADPFGKALLGAYRGKFLKQMSGGGGSGFSGSSFGLPGSISGAMVPPIGIGLGFYGAARSIYSNFLARGRDITLPDNTRMEIQLKKRSPDTP